MVDALCRKLGRGESETIVLAVENSADIVVLDDHVARVEAVRSGLNVKGTLGILKRLMDLDAIQYPLDELYRDLSEMKFRVTRGIFNDIFNS
jgi:predicted nucleic acid-binding protein